MALHLPLSMSLGLSVGRGFKPPPVPGAVIILDFSAGVTVSNGNITAIRDQSGNGNHFTAAGPNGIPYSSNAIAGTPGADTTTGTGNAYLQCVNTQSAVMGAATSGHRFLVLNASAAASQSGSGMMSQNDGGAVSNTLMPFTDGNFYDELLSTSRQTVGAVSTATNIVYDSLSSSSAWTASVNGVQFFTTATNTFAASSSAWSFLGGSGGNFWKGKLAYVLVYPSVLSGSNYTSVISFLRGRGTGF